MGRFGSITNPTLKRLYDKPAQFALWRVQCLTTIGPPKEGEKGHLDDSNAIKSKICEALNCKKEEVALHHVSHLFNFKGVTVFDCNEILKICWKTANAKVARIIWKHMDDRKIGLNTFSVGCLLCVLSRGGCLDEALELLRMLGTGIKKVQPHVIFCSIFLNGCSHIGSILHAEKCLQLIKEKGIKEDELVYLELMKLAGKRKDLATVKKAWALMVKTCKPSMPTVDSYCGAVKALCQVGSVTESLAVLREMLQLVSREESFMLLSEKKMRLKFICEDEGISEKETFTENRGRTDKLACEDMFNDPKQPYMDTPMTDGLTDRVNEKMAQDSTEKSCVKEASESSKVEKGASIPPDLQEDEPLYNLEEDPLDSDAAKSPFGQILEWTRLAMLNLQQSEQTILPENLQSDERHAVGSSTDKFDMVKILLRHAFNAIINASVNQGDLQSAELLFSQMRAANLKPDIYSYNAMLRAVTRGRGLEHGFQVVKRMEKEGLRPDTKTYNAIIEGFCLNMELEKAEALVVRMQKSGSTQWPSDVSFNTILKACADVDDLTRALRVFSRMVEARIRPDRCTILYLISAFGRVNAPYERGTEESKKELASRLSAIESYMENANMQHNSQTFNAVLVSLSEEASTDAVIQRLQLAEGCVDDRGLPILDTVSYNIAMNACIQDKQWATAREIFNKMTSLGFEPSTYTYNILINGCADRRKVGEAFQFLDTMQQKGLQPMPSTYNSLIKVCCHSGELDAALALLKEMGDSGIESSIVTFTTLLASADYHERLDLIEFLVEHMHREKIQPNITTCEHVVSAYLNCHQIDDAVEALRVLSIRMLPKGGKLQGQLEDILKQIFNEDSLQVESSTIQLLKDALISKGLLSEALLAARLSGFGNASIETWNADESTWAKRLRDQYKIMHLV